MVILLGMARVENTLAQREVGVKSGDWADYVVTYEGNSTDEIGGFFVNMTAMTVTVIDVVGTNVTLEGYTYYENGSDTTEIGWIDVETGETGGNFTGPGVLIAANLNQGDRVYTTSQDPFGEGTINETVTRNYLGSPALVNRFVRNITIPPNPFFNLTFNMDWYWFRATGIPAEMTYYYMQELPGTMTWFDIRIVVITVVPEFPPALVMPIFMVATLVAALVYRRAQRRGDDRRSQRLRRQHKH